MLHMDLFGPTNVKSLMKKSYCLVVTDDFSRFSWVFFLATKDETSGILKTFITEIENQLDHKVKVIRCDNGTEFKNSVMNQFCEMKGIKREFSVARTPQQNGVAERRNRTLIEAARTMLPHNKTPYELIRGRTPLIDFMKPFGCPVTILNTRDQLGKFDGKADEGFFVGYSVVSKAIRVFNKRTRIVEETLNIRFLENAPNVTGNGPDWLFDVDSLSKSMNYVPVITENQTNGIAGKRDNIVAGQAEKKIEPEQEYILIPICTTDPLISQDPKVSEEDAEEKTTEMDESGASDKDGEDDQATRSEFERLLQQEKQTVHTNSTNSINTVSTVGPSCTDDDLSSPVNAAEASNAFEEHLFEQFSPFKNAFTLPPVSNVTLMNDTRIFGNAYDDEDVGAEADLNNLETTMNVSPIPTTRIDKDHPKDQIIGDLNSAIQTRRMTKISDEHAMVTQKGDSSFGISKLGRGNAKGASMDVKSTLLYGTIEEEVYVCQPPGFEDPYFPDKVYKVEKALYGLHQAPRAWYETLSTYLIENGFRRGTIDKTLFIKKDKGDILLVQVYVDDIIFGSTKKSLCDEFEGLMHKRFQMSSMGELTLFLGLQAQQKEDGIFISQDKYMAEILKKFDLAIVKTASTPMDPNKALVKDEEADNVDVRLYRSMIGLLMYLTASRPDIMFAVCACARFQVTSKTSHIHAMKRIFRYLKGQPKLGLWYSRDSPFDLEAFSDSDYAGASLDRKSTIRAEYVAAAHCYGQVLWIQNQMLDYGFNFINTMIYIDNESTICIVKNLVFHFKTKHIEIRHHFIKDSYEKKLIQVIKIHTDYNVADLLTKAFNVSRNVFGSKTGSCKINAARQAKHIEYLSSGPPEKVDDEAVHKELGDRMERAATTASSLEVEQDSDGEVKITATIDVQLKTITEASLRRHLKLEDADGISSLPNTKFFLQLALMGYASDSNKLTFQKVHSNPFEQTSEIASTSQKNLCCSTLIQKLFSNMRRVSKGYTEVNIPLFSSMLVQGPIQHGEGSTVPVESHNIPITTPSTSQPPLSSPFRVPTSPHDSPLPGGHTPRSDEGSMTLNELMVLCTQLSTKVASLEQDLKQTKKVYSNAYTKLIMRMKKLEHKVKSRQPRRRARVVISDTEEDLEDPSKQGRRITEID
ncbi:putative ribonuclease H-like domain-containing protein [Tanacetum coccineum]